MQQILVCSDLSDRSRNALARAFRIAAECGAAVTACTIVDDDLPDRTAEERCEEARDRLSATCAEFSANGAEIAVEIGDPVDVVGALADRARADLIVLGTHRHRPLRDLMGRTTMERIVGASRRAVLMAAGPASGGYGSVLAGLDGSPASAAALRTARHLAPEAEFRTFHAVEPASGGWFGGGGDSDRTAADLAAAEDAVARWREAAGLPDDLPQTDVLPMKLEEAFRKMRYEVKPDLVAIGAHGRPGAAPGHLGSFTVSILRWQFCDTLIQRAPQADTA